MEKGEQSLHRQEEEFQDTRQEAAQPGLISMDSDKNKALFLKYFPAYKETAPHDEKKEAKNIDENKTCVYCGNVHVREYNQERFFICDDCRKGFIDIRQEFLEAAIRTKENMETLLDITLKQTPIIKYSIFRRKKTWKYVRNDENAKDKFGFRKDWVTVDIKEAQIVFSIYGGLPQNYFMFLSAVYFLEAFFGSDNAKTVKGMIRLWNYTKHRLDLQFTLYLSYEKTDNPNIGIFGGL